MISCRSQPLKRLWGTLCSMPMSGVSGKESASEFQTLGASAAHNSAHFGLCHPQPLEHLWGSLCRL